MATATLTAAIGWDDSALKRGLSSASSAVGSFARGISNTIAGSVNAMFKLNGAVEFLQKSFSAAQSAIQTALMPAANMEQTEVAFRTLIGSASETKQVMQQLVDLGAETPFEFPEIADAGRKLLAFGTSSKDVAKTLRMIGDVAAGVQAPIGEIAELYGKARVQGTLFAEDINQMTGRGIPVIQDFARQLGVSEEEVKKLASTGQIKFANLEKTFKNMTAEGGLFFEMMKAQSETFTGKISNLSDAWTAVKVAFGTPLINALKPVLDETISGMSAIKESAAAVGKTIGEWVTYMTNAFKSGKGWDALGLDLQIVLAKAANFFGQKMGEVADSIGARLTIANPLASEEDKMRAMLSGVPEANSKPKPGPFESDINQLMALRGAYEKRFNSDAEKRAANAFYTKYADDLVKRAWETGPDDFRMPGGRPTTFNSIDKTTSAVREILSFLEGLVQKGDEP